MKTMMMLLILKLILMQLVWLLQHAVENLCRLGVSKCCISQITFVSMVQRLNFKIYIKHST